MSLVSFNRKEVWVTSIYLLCLVAIIAHLLIKKFENKKNGTMDIMIIASVLCTVFYLFVPEAKLVSKLGMIGGGFMDIRVSFSNYLQ